MARVSDRRGGAGPGEDEAVAGRWRPREAEPARLQPGDARPAASREPGQGPLADQATTVPLPFDPPGVEPTPSAWAGPATGRARTVVVEADRPVRGSFAASLSLVAGVVAALAVLTGALAGPGIALGAVAGLLGLAGLSATGRRHVAGRAEATLGILLGIGTAVLGGLALAGTLDWLDTGTDGTLQLRDWLEARVPWLFPADSAG